MKKTILTLAAAALMISLPTACKKEDVAKATENKTTSNTSQSNNNAVVARYGASGQEWRKACTRRDCKTCEDVPENCLSEDVIVIGTALILINEFDKLIALNDVNAIGSYFKSDKGKVLFPLLYTDMCSEVLGKLQNNTCYINKEVRNNRVSFYIAKEIKTDKQILVLPVVFM